ncbi:MAG: hypothetical protein N2C14_23535, partial [Planctomycetales bacterium]
MMTDRNILFGVLSLQANTLELARFQAAWDDWRASSEKVFSDWAVAEGLLSAEEQQEVLRLVEEYLREPNQDLLSTLGDLENSFLQDLLRQCPEPTVDGETPPDSCCETLDSEISEIPTDATEETAE